MTACLPGPLAYKSIGAVRPRREETPRRAWTLADHRLYQPTTLKAPFLEQFTDDWEKRWKPSHAKKDMKGADNVEEEWAYVGEWSVEEPVVYKGMEGDKGLVVKNPAAHHAISAKFPKKIDNKGKTLVVQYEVKLQGKWQPLPLQRSVRQIQTNTTNLQVVSSVVVLT